jgi:hypothetical protein
MVRMTLWSYTTLTDSAHPATSLLVGSPHAAGPNDPAWGHGPHPVPPAFAGTPRFLALDNLGLALASGTEQGLDGE